MPKKWTKATLTDAAQAFDPDNEWSSESRLVLATYHFGKFMAAIGHDPWTEGELKETPARVALMYATLFTPEPYEPTMFASKASGIVALRGIEFASICAHHFLPYSGAIDVGYIPFRGKVIGLSKLARAVAFESARPTSQETLTLEIMARIQRDTGSPDVIVAARAVHTCMAIRGAKSDAETITSECSGAFRENLSTRMEFLDFIRGR